MVFSYTAAMKKLVCIIGAGHCGSTLLDLVIGSHSSAFSLGELHAIARHINHSNGNYPRICSICEGVCDFWNHRVSLPLIKLFYGRNSSIQRYLGKAARYVYSPYDLLFMWSNRTVLVDSSKQPSWFRRQLMPAYAVRDMEKFLVYISRDGRAVVNSYLRKYPERGIHAVTKNWVSQVLEIDAYFDQFDKKRKILVRYEDLATKPEYTVQSICEFLGMSYEKEMLRYWAHDHHLIAGNAGTNSLVWEYRKRFKKGIPDSKKLHDVVEYRNYYDPEYYEQIGLAIRYDHRWKRELTPEQISIFNAIAGDINKPYASNE
jgi:hypothetical protein